MRPFGFRQAAEFWEVAGDPELAFRLHALIGGAPEDKNRCGGAGPRSLADLDRWVARWLLDPASPMFGVGGRTLEEAATTADPGALAAVLGAISAGAARPAQIAVALGPVGRAGQPGGPVEQATGPAGQPARQAEPLLGELARLGLIERLADPLGGGEDACVIVAPIVRLHQLVIAPHAAELAAGQADRVWALSQAAVATRIYQPHFASVARQWCLRHAAEETLGGVARAARPTAIACREHGREHELEAVFVEEPVAAGRVLAIGETNADGGPMGAGQLGRLDHLRALLPDERVGRPPRLLLFSRCGFSAGLAAAAADRPDVDLVGIERLYEGG
jgi:hypothetical protein